jgi:hypothetical protein
MSQADITYIIKGSAGELVKIKDYAREEKIAIEVS